MKNGTYDFDAIVVGSGVSGGWAAKELTEKGMKTLVLERGKPLEHGSGYVTEHQPPWEVPFRGQRLRELYAKDYPIQNQAAPFFDETTRHFWINDRENPYHLDPGKQFRWYRADVVGGKSLLWARQVYRWSDLDFEANKKDGHGIDWPIRYADIAPWYSHVEKFIGVSGAKLGLPHLPDGEFQKPMDLNILERSVAKHIAENFPGRLLTIGRTATLTEKLPHSNRGTCHYCQHCKRGCSVGASFSSLSSTLPAATQTGNLTLRPNSLVTNLKYDAGTGRVTAVNVIDTESRESMSFSARLVFLCGSAVGSTQVMLNSLSDVFPDGLANGSGMLGRNLMDHTSLVDITCEFDGFDEYYPIGVRPNVIYVPRFRNLGDDADVPFVRGYGFQGLCRRRNWQQMAMRTPGFGAEYKKALRKPGPWSFRLFGFGECLPNEANTMDLHPTKTDSYGVPQVRFNFEWSENELQQRRDMMEQGRAMLESAGGRDVKTVDNDAPGGEAIHEMGTARMGDDPRVSVLNGHNQAHEIPNLFVTDGACMTSSSCVNPSITYMALTARAADYAVTQVQANQI